MKLFIWNDPYHVSYGSSLLIVAAETVEQARKLAEQGKCYKYGLYDKGNPANVPAKDPDRIVECPVAEWHEWSEPHLRNPNASARICR